MSWFREKEKDIKGLKRSDLAPEGRGTIKSLLGETRWKHCIFSFRKGRSLNGKEGFKHILPVLFVQLTEGVVHHWFIPAAHSAFDFYPEKHMGRFCSEWEIVVHYVSLHGSRCRKQSAGPEWDCGIMGTYALTPKVLFIRMSEV